MFRKTHMYVFTCLIVSVVLAASRLPATKGQEKAKEKSESSAGTGGKSLEGLLKEGGLGYIRTTDGQFYRIPVEISGEASMVIGREFPMWDEKVARLVCIVATLPKEFRPSVAMLRRIAEMNGNIIVGNIGMDKDGIYYSSSFWLRTADVQLLKNQLVLAHFTRLNLRKELLPYTQEQ